MTSFYHLMGVREDDFRLSHRFATSWILPPNFLGFLRLLVAVYVFTTIIFILGWQGTRPALADFNDREFSYFTNLTFWGIGFYFLVSAFHTLVYARRGTTPLDHWPRPLQALHSLFYTTIITFPFLVTIVYWIILYNGPWFPNRFNAWSNVSRHGLNSLFALLEVILPATNPPPFLHLLFLVILLALYLALAYLTFATQGFYTYGFLNPSTGSGRVAAYCFGILAAIIVVFIVVWLIIWIRRKSTGAGKKSRADMANTRFGDLEIFETQR